MVTPLHIEIALHYLSGTGRDFDEIQTDVVQAAKNDLFAAGLLTPSRGSFVRTDGLALWIEAMCATPFPVREWVMPAGSRFAPASGHPGGAPRPGMVRDPAQTGRPGDATPERQ